MLDKKRGKNPEDVQSEDAKTGAVHEEWTSVVGRHSVMMALEPRFMFDAAVGATVDAVTENIPDPSEAATPSGEGEGEGEDHADSADADARDNSGPDGADDVGTTGDHRAWEETARERIITMFNLDVGPQAADDPALTFKPGTVVDDEGSLSYEFDMNGSCGLGAVVKDTDGYVKVEITLSNSCKGELVLEDLDAYEYRDIIKENSKGKIVLVGEPDKINELLDQITFSSEEDAKGDLGSINIKVFDEDGDATACIDKTIGINAKEINEAPTLTVVPDKDGGFSVNEDQGLQFVGVGDKPMFVIKDANTSDTLTVEITFGNEDMGGRLGSLAANGDWTAFDATGNPLAGLTIKENSDGTYTYLFTGSQAEVNNFLKDMAYQGAQDQYGNDTLTIRYWDAEQGGETNLPADETLAKQSQTVNIKVAPVNDAPVILDEAPLKTTTVEGGNKILSKNDFLIKDVDNTDDQLVITIGSYGGKGHLEINVGNDTWVTLKADDKFSYSDLFDPAKPGTPGKIRYVHDGDQVRPAGQEESGKFHNSDSFTFSIFDGANGGYYPAQDASGNWLGDLPVFTIDLTPVNQAPVVTVGDGEADKVDIYEGQSNKEIPIVIKDVDQAATGPYTVYITRPDNMDGKLYYKDTGGNKVEITAAMFTEQTLPDGTTAYAFKYVGPLADVTGGGKGLTLVFSHNGNDAYENAGGQRTGETRDVAFRVVVEDDGGGLGASGKEATSQDIVLNVMPNNDLPELGNDGKGNALNPVDKTYDQGKTVDNVVGEIAVGQGHADDKGKGGGWSDIVLKPDNFLTGGLNAFDKDSPDGNITYTIKDWTSNQYDASDGKGVLYYKTSSGAYRALREGDTFTQADLTAGRIVYRYNGTTGDASALSSMTVTITDGSKTAWYEDNNGEHVHQGFEAGYGVWDHTQNKFVLTEVSVVFDVKIPSSGPGFGRPTPPTFEVEIIGDKNNSSTVEEDGDSTLKDILHFETVLKDGTYKVTREGDMLIALDETRGLKIEYDASGDYTYYHKVGETYVKLADVDAFNEVRENIVYYNSIKSSLDGSGKDASGTEFKLDSTTHLLEITTAGGSKLTLDQYEILYQTGNTVTSDDGTTVVVSGKNGVTITLNTTTDAFVYKAANDVVLTPDQYALVNSLTSYSYDSETGTITGIFTSSSANRTGNLVVNVTITKGGVISYAAQVRDSNGAFITTTVDEVTSIKQFPMTAEEFALLFREGNDFFTYYGQIYAQDKNGNRVTWNPETGLSYEVNGKAATKDQYTNSLKKSVPVDLALYKDTMASVDLVYRVEALPKYGSLERWIPGEDGKGPGDEGASGHWVVLNKFDTFYESEIAKGWVKYSHYGDEAFKDEYTVSVSDGQEDRTVNDVKVTVNVTPANDTPTVGGGNELEVREGWQNDTQKGQAAESGFPPLGVAVGNGHINMGDVDSELVPGSSTWTDYNDNGYASDNSLTFVFTEPPAYGWILYYVGDATTKAAIDADNDPSHWIWLDASKNFANAENCTVAMWDKTTGSYKYAADQFTTDALKELYAGKDKSGAFNGVLIFTQQELALGMIRYVHNGDDFNPNQASDPSRKAGFTDRFGVIVNDNKGVGAKGQGGVSTNESSLSEIGYVDVKVTPVNDRPLQSNVSGHKPIDSTGKEGDTKIEFKTPEGGSSIPKEGKGPDGAYTGRPTTIGDENMGTLITKDYLEYTDYDDKYSVIQYTIVDAPDQGKLYLNEGGVWKELSVNSTFTQEDINEGRLKYVHSGSEVHTDSFTFTVSDSKAVIKGDKSSLTGSGVKFDITVTPTNDAPTIENHYEGKVIQDPDRLIYLDHNDKVDGKYTQGLYGKDSANNDKQIFEIKENKDYTTGDGDDKSGLIKDEMQITLTSVVQSSKGNNAKAGDAWGDFDFSQGTTTKDGSGNITSWSKDGFTVTVTTDATGKMVLVGTKDALNEALKHLTVTATSVKDTTTGLDTTDLNGAVKITCTVDDLGNGDGSGKNYNLVDTTHITMYVNTVNSQPVLTPNYEQPTDRVTVKEDSSDSVKFDNGKFITISDFDAMSREGTLTLKVDKGTLDLGYLTGITFVSETEGGTPTCNGSGTIVIKGTLENLQKALDSLKYQGPENYNGLGTNGATLTVSYNDNSYIKDPAAAGNNSEATPSVVVNIDITAQNDRPTIVVPNSPRPIEEGAGYNKIDGISVDDSTDWKPENPSDPTGNKDPWTAKKELDVKVEATLDDTTTSVGTIIFKPGTNVVVDPGDIGANGAIEDGIYVVTKDGSGKYTLVKHTSQTDRPTTGMYVEISGSATSAINIGGTAEVVNEILKDLHYSKGTATNIVNHAVNLKVTVDDHHSGTNSKPSDGPDNNIATENITLVVSNQNRAPVITVPSGYETVEDKGKGTAPGLVLDKITIIDNDSPGGKFTITFTVDSGKGTLLITDPTLVRKISAGGSGGNTITFDNMTQADVDRLLNSGLLSFKPTPDYNGNVTLTITAQDNGSYLGGAAGANPVTDPRVETVNIKVTPVNDRPHIDQPSNKPPVIDLGKPASGSDNTQYKEGEEAVANLNVKDLIGDLYNDKNDKATNNGAGIEVFPGNDADEKSQLDITGIVVTTNPATASQGEWMYKTPTGEWTKIPSNITTGQGYFIPADAVLKFVPNGDFNGEAPQLTVKVVDNAAVTAETPALKTPGGAIMDMTTGGLVQTGGDYAKQESRISSDTAQIGFKVNNVNDAPTIVGDATVKTTEDTKTGTTIPSLKDQLFSDAKDQQKGTGNTTGSDANDFGGIVIVGNGTTYPDAGVWEYTTDGGTTWTPVGNVGEGNGLFLAADPNTSIRFSPNPDYNGPAPELTVHVVEKDGSGNVPTDCVNGQKGVDLTGGKAPTDTGRVSIGTGKITTTVTAVNDAPEINTGTNETPSYATDDSTTITWNINEDLMEGPKSTTKQPNNGHTIDKLFNNKNPQAGDLVDHQIFNDDRDDQTNGSDSNIFAGVVIVGVDSTDAAAGDWIIIINGTETKLSAWVTANGAISSTNGLFLPPEATIVFRPAEHANGPAPVLTVHIVETGAKNDFSTGTPVNASTTGGSSQFSKQTVDIVVDVKPINDKPEFTQKPDKTVEIAVGDTYTTVKSGDKYIQIGDANDYSKGEWDPNTTDGSDQMEVTIQAKKDSVNGDPIGKLKIDGTLPTGVTVVQDPDHPDKIVITGPKDAVNQALKNLQYSGGDAALFTKVVLDITVNDCGNGQELGANAGWTSGNTNALTENTQVEMSILATNTAPKVDGPTNSLILPEDSDTGITFNGANKITVTDKEGAGKITVDVSVGNGKLTFPDSYTPPAGSTATKDGTGKWTITGTQDQVNSILENLTYKPNQDYNGTDKLTIVSKDDGSGKFIGGTESANPGKVATETKVVDIKVTPVNDGPEFTQEVSNQIKLTEGSETYVPIKTGDGKTIQFNDNKDYITGEWTPGKAGESPDRMEIAITAKVKDSDTLIGGFNVDLTGTGVSIVEQKDGTLVLSGSQADLNKVLETLGYCAGKTTANNTEIVINVVVNDLGNGEALGDNTGWNTGNDNALTDSTVVNVIVLGGNAAPEVTGPTELILPEDGKLALTGNKTISVSDREGAGKITVNVSVGHGDLTFPDGYAPTGLTQEANGSWTITGTQDEVNAILGNLGYKPDADYNGPDTLTIVTSDDGSGVYKGNEGGGANPTEAKSATTTIDITVTPLNDAPDFTHEITDTIVVEAGADNYTAIKDANGKYIQFQDDVDYQAGNGWQPGTEGSDKVIVTITAKDDGTLVGDFKVDTTGTDVTYTEKDGTIVLTGSKDEVNAVLKTLEYSAGDSVHNNTEVIINVNVNDCGNGQELGSNTGWNAGNTNAKDIDTTVKLIVLAENAAPEVTAPPSLTLPEDTDISFTGNNKITVTDHEGADEITVNVSVGHGELTFPDDYAPTGLTKEADGSWTIKGSQTDVNTILGNLGYKPDADYNGPDALTITTADDGSGTYLDSATDPKAANGTKVIPITVTPVNDAPEFTNEIDDVLVVEAGSGKYTAIVDANGNPIQFQDDVDYQAGNGWQPGDEGSDKVEVTITAKDGGTLVGDFRVDTTGTDVIVTEENGKIVLTGAKDEVNKVLETLEYSAGDSVKNNTDVVINVHVTDCGNGQDLGSNTGWSAGNTNAETIDTVVELVVRGENAAPEVGGPSSVILPEDSDTTFTGDNKITITDYEGAGEITVNVSVGHGELTFPGGAPAGVTPGANGSWTITGTQTEVNQILESLTYKPDADYNGPDALTVVTTDDGSGTYLKSDTDPTPATGTTVIPITVTPVNDAPEFTQEITDTIVVEAGADKYTPIKTPDGKPVQFDDAADYRAGDAWQPAVKGSDQIEVTITAKVDGAGNLIGDFRVDTAGTGVTFTEDNGKIILTGSKDDVNKVLATLEYSAGNGVENNTGITIDIHVTDCGNGQELGANSGWNAGNSCAASIDTAVKVTVFAEAKSEEPKPEPKPEPEQPDPEDPNTPDDDDVVDWVEPPAPPTPPDTSTTDPLGEQKDPGLPTLPGLDPEKNVNADSDIVVNVEQAADASEQHVSQQQDSVGKELGTKPPSFQELTDISDNSAWPDDYELYGNTDEKLALLNVKQDFPLPEDLFIHTKQGERLEYSASLEDGSPLPDWMEFNPDDFVITATPPEGSEGSMTVLIKAEDTKGNRADATVIFKIGEENESATELATKNADGAEARGEDDGEEVAVAEEEEEREPGLEEVADVDVEAVNPEGDTAEAETVPDELMLTNEWLLREAQDAEEAEKQAEADSEKKDSDVHPGLKQQIAESGTSGLLAKARELVDSLFMF